MSMTRRVLAWLVSLAVTLGVVVLSRAPMAAERGDHALLRLTWSARPEQVEICQQVSEEELAELPAHMRRTQVCEGRSVRYRLIVAADEVTVLEDTLAGGGARGDRLIYLLREVAFPAGPHLIRVTQDALDAPSADSLDRAPAPADTTTGMRLDREARERQEAERRRQEAVPRSLVWEATVEFGSRQVVLVTYDAQQRRLVSISDSGN